MSKTRQEIEKQLDENIPASAVAKRSGGGSKALSYLETWYVIDRLNRVFGNMGWDCETTEMHLVSTGDSLPAYRAKVKITVSSPVTEADGSVVGFRNVVKEGTGWGSDKSKQNAHEMACKEAESDALKRAAMKLGKSMGLALYDKTQEFVGDPEPAPKAAPKAPTPVYTHEDDLGGEPGKVINRAAINSAITANGKLLIAKGVYTSEAFKAMRKEKYGVDSTEALTDSQANELLTNLKKEVANGKST